jgi:hypothetical protein
VSVFKVPHPSSDELGKLQREWRKAIDSLRQVVTADADAEPDLPNYGRKFRQSDYTPIPKRDLPFGLPAWFGDDEWGRKDSPPHYNCVERPRTDPEHRLAWRAPTNQP